MDGVHPVFADAVSGTHTGWEEAREGLLAHGSEEAMSSEEGPRGNENAGIHRADDDEADDAVAPGPVDERSFEAGRRFQDRTYNRDARRSREAEDRKEDRRFHGTLPPRRTHLRRPRPEPRIHVRRPRRC